MQNENKLKMNKIKKVKIFTILIHSFIIIGAGHGIGIMGILDIIGITQIPEMLKNGIKFSLNGDFQDRLSLVIIFSLIGKVILIISFILKGNWKKNITSIFGIIILWISVYLLSSGNWNYDSLYEIAFWTSAPFLISSIIFTYLIIKNVKQNIERNKKPIANNVYN